MPLNGTGLEDAAAPSKPGVFLNGSDAFKPSENIAPAHKKQASSAAVARRRGSIAEEARLRCLACRLHALGEKPLYHFLTDLERGAPLRQTLEIYAELDADFIKAFGGDRFAAPWAIEGRRRP